MNQIQKGLFAVEGEMPCNPQDITVWSYTLPNTLGGIEREEAVARILSFSQQLDQWVGVSWQRLVEMMQGEYEARMEIEETRAFNSRERRRAWWVVRGYYVLCVLTLGVFGLFKFKPVASLREVPDKKMPYTGTLIYGPRFVARGILDLVNSGLLKCAGESKESGDTLEVFFPTPALISCIMQKQGVAAS